MKMIKISLLAVAAISGLAGCQQGHGPLNAVPPRGIQTFRAAQPTGAVRSNAGLDAIAKRSRFVLFQSSDRNRDNQVAPQEFSVPGFNFATYDKNKDGQLNFSEFDAAMIKHQPYGVNREGLRQQAQMMWQQINKDNNAVLLRTEVEEYFTAPYNNPPMPVMPVTPIPEPTPSAVPSGDPYSGGYGNGYGSGYGTPYSPYPNYEQLKYEARKQAIEFFVQTDVNFDQKLSFSEYEDGYAKQMLSSMENSLSNSYPNYYPPSTPAYPGSYPAYPAR